MILLNLTLTYFRDRGQPTHHIHYTHSLTHLHTLTRTNRWLFWFITHNKRVKCPRNMRDDQ